MGLSGLGFFLILLILSKKGHVDEIRKIDSVGSFYVAFLSARFNSWRVLCGRRRSLE
ncbi:hypothetical protein SBDP1_1090041 [Syntrophobacter sp. SbD1]|nr:hypothetical protein SBDP1_1090041 [Syntrophobacter sp. SbD1]